MQSVIFRNLHLESAIELTMLSLLSSQLILLRQQVGQIAQRYPALVSAQSDMEERLSQIGDWMHLNHLTGEPRVVLSSFWTALHRPEPEAQKHLARVHFEILFSDPVLGQKIFKDPIHGFAGYSEDKEGILRMIGERGFDGYIGFLISVMNQQWSHVWMVESVRFQKGLPLDDEETDLHNESARTIDQLLSRIGESRLVGRHFRNGWLAKVAHGHDLDVVRSTVDTALQRAHLRANLTLAASPQSLSKP